jgi:hypothetical protein
VAHPQGHFTPAFAGYVRARTRFMLRMSPKALHGDPDRVRHTRLPHRRIFTGVVRAPARIPYG